MSSFPVSSRRGLLCLAICLLPIFASAVVALPKSSDDGILSQDEPRVLIPEFQVNENVGTVAKRCTEPIVTLDSASAYTIVWREMRGRALENGGDVYARRYASDGQALGDGFRVNRVITDRLFMGSILASADAAGNTYVVWEEEHKPYASEWFMQRIAPDGSLDGPDRQLDLDSSLLSNRTHLAASSFQDGRFAMYWIKEQQVWLQVFSQDARPFGTAVVVNDARSPAALEELTFASNSAGRYVLTWVNVSLEDSSPRGNQHIYAREFASNGSALRAPFRVDDDGRPKAQRQVSAVINSNGDIVFAWVVNDVDDLRTEFTVYARSYSGESSSFLAAGLPVKEPDISDAFVMLRPHIDEQRRLKLAWIVRETINGPAVLQRVDVDFSSDGTIRELPPNHLPYPYITDAEFGWQMPGEILMVREYGSSRIKSRIEMQRFDTSGALLAGEVVSNDDGPDKQWCSSVALRNEKMVFAWSCGENDDWDLQARFFDSQGVALFPSWRVGQNHIPHEPPGLTVVGNGDLAFLWTIDVNSGLLAGRYTPYGNAVYGTKTVNTYFPPGSVSRKFIKASSDAKGRFIATWHAQEDSVWKIYAQRYNKYANPVDRLITVSDVSDTSRRWVNDVALNNDGSFVIVWGDLRDRDSGMYARRFEWDKLEAGPEIFIHSEPGASYYSHTQVAMSERGAFTVSLVKSESEAEHQAIVYYRLFGSDDRPLTEALPVDTGFVGAFSTAVDFDRDGSFAVAWIDTVDNYRLSTLHARRFSKLGEPLGPSTLLNRDVKGFCFCPDIELHDASLYATWSIDSYAGTGFDIRATALAWEDKPIINNIAAGETDPDPSVSFQLSPNPLGRYAECRYRLHRRSRVSLTLFDVHGRRLRLLLDDIQGPGEHSRRIDGAGLSTGVYYIELRVNAGASVQPLIIGSE